MTIPDFSLGDVFWLCVKIVITSAVARWAYLTVRGHWFGPGDEETEEDEEEKEKEDEDENEEDEEEDEEDEEDEEAIFEGERVFHVGAVKSGGSRIVVANSEAEALRVGARVLETDEEDVIASEVYDNAARAEDRK